MITRRLLDRPRIVSNVHEQPGVERGYHLENWLGLLFVIPAKTLRRSMARHRNSTVQFRILSGLRRSASRQEKGFSESSLWTTARRRSRNSGPSIPTGNRPAHGYTPCRSARQWNQFCGICMFTETPTRDQAYRSVDHAVSVMLLRTGLGTNSSLRNHMEDVRLGVHAVLGPKIPYSIPVTTHGDSNREMSRYTVIQVESLPVARQVGIR
jgi:hypothetical protein